MFVQVMRRSQIADVLLPRRATLNPEMVEHVWQLPSLERSRVAAVWRDDPRVSSALPEVLLTGEGEEAETLAWLMTYIATLRPLTAFIRIFSVRGFVDRTQTIKLPRLGRLTEAVVGLVLGEVLASQRTYRRRPVTTFASCAGSFAFACARAIALYDRSVDLARLWDRWLETRRLARVDDISSVSNEVLAPARVLEAIALSAPPPAGHESQFHACLELLSAGQLEQSAGQFGSAFKEAVRNMTGTREERLHVVERYLAASSASDATKSFELGFLLSRLNPGTLSHIGFLLPSSSRLPGAALWYGVCAGLEQSGGVMNEFGGVGRRVLRELLRTDTLLSRTTADIDATEFQLLTSMGVAEDIPVSAPSQICIELMPGIHTTAPWGRAPQSAANASGASSDRAWIDHEIGSVISHLMSVRNRMRGGAAGDPPDQKELFESPQGKPRRKM